MWGGCEGADVGGGGTDEAVRGLGRGSPLGRGSLVRVSSEGANASREGVEKAKRGGGGRGEVGLVVTGVGVGDIRGELKPMKSSARHCQVNH